METSLIQSGVVLQVILVLIAGILAARVGRRLNVPVIIPLIIAGYLLGPDLLNYFALGQYGISLGILAAIAVPIILFYDGLKTDPRILKSSLITVISINTVAVLVTVFGIAFAAHTFLGLSWLTAFLFGSILASTDPAGILPLLKKLNVDKRVSSIIEAETAFNDAAALALFGVVIGVATTQTFSIQDGFAQFLTLSFGSVLLGYIMGTTITELLTKLKVGHDLAFASIAVLFAAFFVSELFLINGSIAAVAAAVVFGAYVRSKHVESIQRMYTLNAWDDINFLAIALIFLGLGANLQFEKILPYLPVGIVISAIFMGIVRPVTILLSMFFDKTFTLREKLFIALIGGPRGTVSAALASTAFIMAAPGGVLAGMSREIELVFYTTLVVIVLTVGATSAYATFVTKWLLGTRESEIDEKYRTLRTELKGMTIASHRLRDEWKSGLISTKIYDELEAQQSSLIKTAEHELARVSRTHPELEFSEKLDKTKDIMATQINTLEEAYTNKEISEKSYRHLLEKYNAALGRLMELEGEKAEHGGGK